MSAAAFFWWWWLTGCRTRWCAWVCDASIIDKDHNVVSWTTTVEENLGSAVVVPGRGFLLNNELTGVCGLHSALHS